MKFSANDNQLFKSRYTAFKQLVIVFKTTLENNGVTKPLKFLYHLNGLQLYLYF